MLVASRVVSQLDDSSRGDFHNVDVVGPGFREPPMKSEKQTVGRPGGAAGVAAPSRGGDATQVGAVRRHDVNLGCAASVRNKGHFTARLGIPRRRNIHPRRKCEPLEVEAIDVGDVNLRVAAHTGTKGYLLSIG